MMSVFRHIIKKSAYYSQKKIGGAIASEFTTQIDFTELVSIQKP